LYARRALPDSTPIFPLDEPIGAVLFGARTLEQLVNDAARTCGLEVVELDAHEPLPAGVVVVGRADVVVNGAALQALLDAAAGAPHTVQAAVAPQTTLFAASTRLLDVDPTQPLRVPLWAHVHGEVQCTNDAALAVVADEAGHVDVDVRPYGPPPHVLAIADVRRVLGWPRHWLHVLDLSLAALRTTVAGLPEQAPRRASIHPTARVVRSVLGNNVKVEAHVSIVDSVIGDDVLVGDHTVIHGSVIGAGCRTLVDTHLRRCVAMPGSTLSNLDMQDALLGREIFLTTGVAFFHDGPGRNVIVDERDSGRPVLAGAVGKRALLGSRALFRCGVALPAGALVVARPEESLGKIDERGLLRAHMRFGDRAIDV
jgi:carbonic anhydrase/acetyltransferase-like protein (isoleucine patch superfamily)